MIFIRHEKRSVCSKVTYQCCRIMFYLVKFLIRMLRHLTSWLFRRRPSAKLLFPGIKDIYDYRQYMQTLAINSYAVHNVGRSLPTVYTQCRNIPYTSPDFRRVALPPPLFNNSEEMNASLIQLDEWQIF